MEKTRQHCFSYETITDIVLLILTFRKEETIQRHARTTVFILKNVIKIIIKFVNETIF